MRATVGNARDHRANDRAYQEYLADKAREDAEAKAAADAAQAAADAQNPELQFKRAADAEAQTVLELLRTGYVPESILPGDRVNGRKINEDVAASNFKLWAQQESTFQRYMFETLYAAMKRNDLAPIANNFGTLHRLLLQYGAYPNEPVQVVARAPVEELPPVLSRSEQAVIDHQRYCEEIIGHDESGKGWTMQEVDALPSKEMLRLLRLFEQGHRGSNLLTIRREVLDIKQQQDAERARRAEEDER